MSEVETTYYSWQMPRSVDARGLCASVPTARSQAQFELIQTCMNELSSCKYILADMGISSLVSVFSFTGNISLPQV